MWCGKMWCRILFKILSVFAPLWSWEERVVIIKSRFTEFCNSLQVILAGFKNSFPTKESYFSASISFVLNFVKFVKRMFNLGSISCMTAASTISFVPTDQSKLSIDLVSVPENIFYKTLLLHSKST